MDEARYVKARSLVRRLCKLRRTQAKLIDILCNDMVNAHRDFLQHLRVLNFSVGFYESILGKGDLRSLLDTAARCIKDHVNNSSVVVFLRECEGFNLHMVDENKPIEVDCRRLESYFTSEVVDRLSRANRVCSLDDMFEMGLEGDLPILNRISAGAVPIKQAGPGLGFVLIYRSVENPLGSQELAGLAGVMSGLYRAIEDCKVSVPAPTIH